MKTKVLVRLLTGSLVLGSLLLAYLINPWWLVLAGFVGANLFQSAFTDLCLIEFLLETGFGGNNSKRASTPAKTNQISPDIASPP